MLSSELKICTSPYLPVSISRGYIWRKFSISIVCRVSLPEFGHVARVATQDAREAMAMYGIGKSDRGKMRRGRVA